MRLGAHARARHFCLKVMILKVLSASRRIAGLKILLHLSTALVVILTGVSMETEKSAGEGCVWKGGGGGGSALLDLQR